MSIPVSILIAINIILLTSSEPHLVQEQWGSLQGSTGILEGNCMPGPGVPPCEPRPTSMKVFITQPTEHYQINMVRDSVISDADGNFEIRLPEGKYSLFIQDDDHRVCGGPMECTPECICLPVFIKADSVTTVKVNLDKANW